ncbi:hypothetical protein KR009_003728, partial [Drosophila setifemur]
ISKKKDTRILISIIYNPIFQITSKFEFTNIKCTSLDKNFSDFDYCFIKPVNRTFKYISLKCKLYKIPITKVKLNVAMYKRYNGYRPFMYNLTIDACRFLKNPDKNTFFSWLYPFFIEYTNMNHPCPFDHDLLVDKLPGEFVSLRRIVLPFPEGDYLFESNWIAYDIPRARVKIYGTLS